MLENNIPLLPQMDDLWQQSLNWQPSTEQKSQFQRLYELIIVGNQQLNLTRITAPQEFWEKHLWDSLRGIAPFLKGRVEEGENSSFIIQHSSFKIIDIGTGAGFPGIPVAITLPDSQVTLLDSIRKKIAFLDTLIAQLGIQNIDTLTGRAEIVGKQPQQQQAYDIALIRAVGSVSACAEYALPLLKPEGLAILYRGNWTTDEAETLQSTVKKLGGVIEQVERFSTPLSNSIRHCVYLKKARGEK
jgi:16S rRNA (guanine527-N7)-methyltransferase